MRGFVQRMFNLGVIGAVVLSVTMVNAAPSDDTSMPNKGAAKSAKTGKKGADGSKNRVFTIPKEISLTSEQQTKLDEIKKEQGPKILELTTKLSAVLTDEQKAARKKAAAKAKEDGMTGKAATAIIDEAVNLTDEQKKQQAEMLPELAKLRLSIKEQIHSLLTDEQKAYYKLPKSKKAKAT